MLISNYLNDSLLKFSTGRTLTSCISSYKEKTLDIIYHEILSTKGCVKHNFAFKDDADSPAVGCAALLEEDQREESYYLY